ncbi:MAG: hypothetical protein VKI82_13415 [Leptolyngbya sp.]|nr:hypothetical protein [Leptolyngbya sp.]
MHDNKVRLSPDVLEKAERIAAEWGLKNARAAVEAVFRTYCDDYLHSRSPAPSPRASSPIGPAYGASYGYAPKGYTTQALATETCDAVEALDQLLAL